MPVMSGGNIMPGSRQRGAATVGGTGENDGSVGPFLSAGVPASGYLNNVAGKGAIVIDTTNGKAYINTGTLSATVYTVVGAQT